MTTTAAAVAPKPTGSRTAALSFAGTLRSEWIKLRSLRSTVWCYGIVIAITVLFGILIAQTASATFASGGSLTQEDQQSYALLVSTLGIGFSQLVAAVLGVLVISGEYGTGMIRSTFTAVPKRLPALFAKAIVFGVVTFVVGLVSIFATALITAPMLPKSGITPDFGDSQFLLALVGGALYLALIGILSLAIGTIVRNSAGGIAASLGLVLVLPPVLQIIVAMTQAEWAQNLAMFLPDQAGGRLYAYAAEASVTGGVIVLDSLQGGLVMLAWVAVMFVIASVLLKRRDV
ncbi:ABC-2 type transport system permease protein [Glaciihabitans tibetensis]|uniref:ABC-2 type transport system permease protein n=1 Tax=Glaciihabitans tibetensis TaxID=1266600 RepID=A0A2T0VIN2_9MICO|nr:ABC transporter permease subunit [Glaciihabitans tibetensis]PRY70081.1 ABC-2 type transport system permease protein [Glaciihabitans tibetensis]